MNDNNPKTCTWSFDPGPIAYEAGRVTEWQLYVPCAKEHIIMTPNDNIAELFEKALEPNTHVKCPKCRKELVFFDNTTS